MLDRYNIGTTISAIQGEIFEESTDMGLDSAKFIELFMNGITAWHLDLPRHKASWCGKGYIIDEFFRENNAPAGKTWPYDFMHWTGFIYRFWHYFTGQYSKEIYLIGPPDLLMRLYPRCHNQPVENAVRMIFHERELPVPNWRK